MSHLCKDTNKTKMKLGIRLIISNTKMKEGKGEKQMQTDEKRQRGKM